MPSGWEVYYVVFLSAILALGVPAALGVFSWIVAPKRGSRRPSQNAEEKVQLSAAVPAAPEKIRTRRVNTRYFLAANASLVLLALGMLLVPVSVVIHPDHGAEVVGKGLVAVLSIAGFSALGLLYSSRKGDPSWIRSYQRADSSEKRGKS